MRSSRQFSDSESASRSASRSRRGRKRRRSPSRDRRRRKRRRSRSRSRRRRTRRRKSRDRDRTRNGSSRKKSREKSRERTPPPPAPKEEENEKKEGEKETIVEPKEIKKEEVSGSGETPKDSKVDVKTEASQVKKEDGSDGGEKSSKKEEIKVEKDSGEVKQEGGKSPKRAPSEENWKVVKKEKKRSRSPKKEKKRSSSRGRRRRRRSRSRSRGTKKDRGRRRRTRSRSRDKRDKTRRRRSRDRDRDRRDRDRDRKRKSSGDKRKEDVKKESSSDSKKTNSVTDKKKKDWEELERSGRKKKRESSDSKSSRSSTSVKKEKKETDTKSAVTSGSLKKDGEKSPEEKLKRIEDDPPPKPLTEAERKEQQKQLDKIQRLMKWKAKQQAKNLDKREVQAFEFERKRLQEQAKRVKEEREAAQKKKFEETERMWAEKKKKFEMEMELKLQKRLEERSRKIAKAQVAKTIKRARGKKKIGFSFGGKKPVAKPIVNAPNTPANPPGLNDAPIGPPGVKKEEEVNNNDNATTSTSTTTINSEASSSTLPTTTTINPPPSLTPTTESQDEPTENDLAMQQKLQARLDPANQANLSTTTESMVTEDGATTTETTDSAAMEIEEEQEIDTLDAFMNQIADVQKVDDEKKKGKKGSEVIWGDQTVYEEEDLVIEDETPAVKNWSIKKKELKPVDHLTQDYEPFQKKFYIEALEIKNMTDEEVKKFQEEEMKGVKIHGQDCPRPIKKWTQCGLPERVMRALAKCEYEKPFPIQCQTIPAIMSGRDVIGCARTGSGKTCAFVLPMIRHILAQRPIENGEGPVSVIITPTRELCMQIYHESKRFAKACNLRVVAVYGGAPISEQIACLKRGAEVIVCTPGRMIDILCTNQGRVTNVKRVTYLVLDEADRMFDLGFEPQIMSIIRQCRPDRQICMFSATFPRVIENLARQILDSPLEIIVGGRSIASEDVNQFIELHDESSKFKRLLELLGKWYNRGSILIFHDQQEKVDNLFQQLQRVGYLAGIMHGGVDQFDRENTINDFKSGVKTIMIATSVCSRGLDVKDLKVVINYSAPHHYEDYVHRIGRTGRAGTKGWAYTFIDAEKEAKFTPDIIKAMNKANMQKNIPEEVLEISKQFKDKVRDGKEIAYHARGYKTKGYKFDEEEAKAKEKQKMRQRHMHADPDEIPDVVLSELEKSKIKQKNAKAQLEDIKKNEESGDPVSQTIKAITAAMKALKEKGASSSQVKRKIKNETKKVKAKFLRNQKMHAQAIANKMACDEQIQKYEKEDKYTCRIYLHEYPEGVRRKMFSWSTLNQTKNLVGDRVDIFKRGVFLTAGERLQAGAENQHLLIQGDNQFSVNCATRELHRVLNDALEHSRVRAGTATGGRYSVM